QFREGGDMSSSKHHRRVTGRDGMAFEKSLADAAAVKRSAGQIATKGTADTLLARFPVVRPGSCHGTVPTLGGSWRTGRQARALPRPGCDVKRGDGDRSGDGHAHESRA